MFINCVLTPAVWPRMISAPLGSPLWLCNCVMFTKERPVRSTHPQLAPYMLRLLSVCGQCTLTFLNPCPSLLNHFEMSDRGKRLGPQWWWWRQSRNALPQVQCNVCRQYRWQKDFPWCWEMRWTEFKQTYCSLMCLQRYPSTHPRDLMTPKPWASPTTSRKRSPDRANKVQFVWTSVKPERRRSRAQKCCCESERADVRGCKVLTFTSISKHCGEILHGTALFNFCCETKDDDRCRRPLLTFQDISRERRNI